jgi:hypothetical protein
MSCRTALLVAAILAASGTSANATERPLRISAEARAACMPDARRLCREALPNVRRVVVCFLGNRSKLSSPCRAVLASYGL